MNKNNIIGFSLIGIVLLGYYWYNSSTMDERQKEAQQKKTEQVAEQVSKQKADENKKAKEEADLQKAQTDTTYVLHCAMSGTDNDYVLENSKIQLTFSSKGGVVTKAVVKGYKDINGQPNVTLFTGKEQSLAYVIDGKDHNINTGDLYFKPVSQSKSDLVLAAGDSIHRIVMTYHLGDGYILSASLKAEGLEGLIPSKTDTMSIKWHQDCKQQEKGHSFENRYASLTYHNADGGTDYLSETGDDEEKLEETADWIAYKNQFFSSMIIAKDNFKVGSDLKSKFYKDGKLLKTYDSNLTTSFDPSGKKASEFEFFFGPNDFRLLQNVEETQSNIGKEHDLQMERLVYLGWPLFRIINRWFTLYLFDFLTSWGIPMGIVIILLTLILKVITYPMVKKSYMSSAKMRVLRPKLDAATKKYDKPEDAMKKQQEMMTLYSKYGVSPMSGCLPMLIQMPIWIAMFNFVPNAIQLRGESFLWIDDLSTYDVLFQWNDSLPLIGDHLSLTCILFCASNLLYSWFTMRQQRDQMVGQQAQQMKMMQWMMFLMPVMFFFMFNDYSAGLNFYYFISLFCSAAIMFTLRKTTNDEKLLAILEKKYKENEANPKKLTGLAGRLQAMQKQQQEMERKRQELYNKRQGK